MGEVVILDCETSLPIPPNRILEAAIDKLDFVLVLGIGKDGKAYVAASESDTAQCLMVASQFIHDLHDGRYD